MTEPDALDKHLEATAMQPHVDESEAAYTARQLQRTGFILLFLVEFLILIRLMIDPVMIRRPLLDPNLTTGGLYFISISLFVFMMGNVVVGQPMMATMRAEAYGLPKEAIVGLFGSATGIGAVIGSLVAGFFARPSAAIYGPLLMVIALFRGLTMLGLGYFTDIDNVIIMFGLFGLFMGYTMVFFSTWMQQRVEISLLGRMMSVMMFAMMGVMPVSSAFWGFGIEEWGIEALYYISGIAMAIVAIGGLISPSIRLMGYPPGYKPGRPAE